MDTGAKDGYRTSTWQLSKIINTFYANQKNVNAFYKIYAQCPDNHCAFLSGIIQLNILDVDNYFQILLCYFSLFYMIFRKDNTAETQKKLIHISQIIFAINK